jgi:hypothetical protein
MFGLSERMAGPKQRKKTMTYKAYDTKAREEAKVWVGKRVEIPVHYDLWMRGARFGTVKQLRFHGATEDLCGSAYLTIELDHPQVKRRLKVWRSDWAYMTLQES